jgi:hypothetical protein
MRDWRSGIVTVTVRDQRMRQHDTILGVVPLKLSDILQTSSQVTRWYPLDGGIGFGRIRISVLFRSVETRLPLNQLGWDVGTFEFTSEKILALNYKSNAKLKLRTGGSSGSISRTQCKQLDEGDGISWDIAKKDGKNNVRLPVRYRYRSPVVFEFHTVGKRHADAYAVIWLHHLEDNKEENINIPIWKTDRGMRLTQNYITEENFNSIPDIKIEEVGRLQFRCRFKAGTDMDHEKFVTDNDSRETQETWEACHSEGVRGTIVTKELPPAVQELHDQSLTQGRDVLAKADEDEKKKWLAKDGTDWSGAFGEDPAKYADLKGTRKFNNPNGSSMADKNSVRRGPANGYADEEDEDDDDDSDSDESDLGIVDATNSNEHTDGRGTIGGSGGNDHTDHNSLPSKGFTAGNSTKGKVEEYKSNKKDLHRKNRGLMQWKPIRNIAFAKDEAKFMVRRTIRKASLAGRSPDVETET